MKKITHSFLHHQYNFIYITFKGSVNFFSTPSVRSSASTSLQIQIRCALKLRLSVTCDGFKKRLSADDSRYFIKNRSIRCVAYCVTAQQFKFAYSKVYRRAERKQNPRWMTDGICVISDDSLYYLLPCNLFIFMKNHSKLFACY